MTMSQIEILKRGSRDAAERKVDVVCEGCHSVLRVPKSKTKYQSSPKPNDDFYECRCPVCKERIIIYPRQFK